MRIKRFVIFFCKNVNVANSYQQIRPYVTELKNNRLLPKKKERHLTRNRKGE